MIRPLEIADAEAVAAIARRARIGAIPRFPDLHSPAEDLGIGTDCHVREPIVTCIDCSMNVAIVHP